MGFCPPALPLGVRLRLSPAPKKALQEPGKAASSSSLAAAVWEQPGLQVQEPSGAVSQLQHGQLPAAQKGRAPRSWQDSNLRGETPMDF